MGAETPRIIEDKGGYAHSNGEHAYDVDGDGWIDVVSNSFWLPEVNWYRNPGEKGLKPVVGAEPFDRYQPEDQ